MYTGDDQSFFMHSRHVDSLLGARFKTWRLMDTALRQVRLCSYRRARPSSRTYITTASLA